MPLFALANAGVSFSGLDLVRPESLRVFAGVALGLMVGKPFGVFCVSWLLVRSGLCRLPTGVTWPGIGLVAILSGVGFTMSVFIAMLAFHEPRILAVAKLGVLIGSLLAGIFGLGWGILYSRRLCKDMSKPAARSPVV